MSLALRSTAEELMDADDLDQASYTALIGDLARVNTVTLARRPTLAFLKRAAAGRTTLRVLDVGFGDGDMLRSIARWSMRHGIAAELVGVDLNPRSEPAARARTPGDLDVRYVTGDHTDMGGGWDAVVSNLVAHHMTHDQIVAFLRWMEANARAWFVNDVHRHRLAHLGWPALARLARWHPIVRHDGHVSIARAFRPPEWRAILAEAGIHDAQVRRIFPFRLCVQRLR